MYLRYVRLWNYRQFGQPNDNLNREPDLTVELNKGLTLLVGENDSGKSTIVDAINHVIVPHSHEYYYTINLEDFHHHDGMQSPQRRLKIECELTGFTADEAMHFYEYLTIPDSIERGLPEGMDLNEWMAENMDKLKLILLLEAEQLDGEVPRCTLKAEVYEDQIGFPNELRDFLRSMYLKPLRNAAFELTAKPKSRLSRVLSKHKNFKEKDGEPPHPLTQIFLKANKDLIDYFKGVLVGTDSRGRETSEEIHEHLRNLFSKRAQRGASFSASTAELEDVLQKLSLELDEKKSGLGSLNLLFMAVELLLLKHDTFQGLHLGIIEEAEAHLHTQAQMRVLKYYQGLSAHPAQLVITTHSPYIASEVGLNSIVLCNSDVAFSLKESLTKLDRSDYAFLERFLDATKANLFFAEGVIFVEGYAENLLLPVIARLLGKDLVDFGVSIVNVGHVGFFRYTRIFLRADDARMKVPVACIRDNDVKYESVQQGAKVFTMPDANTLRQSREDKSAQYNEGPIKCVVSPNWTLEFDIALDDLLREPFYRAVLYARKAKNASGDSFLTKEAREAADVQAESDIKKWETEFQGDTNLKAKIAYEIYKKSAENKTLTAQFFAEFLESKHGDISFVRRFKQSGQLAYIFEAIEHTTVMDG